MKADEEKRKLALEHEGNLRKQLLKTGEVQRELLNMHAVIASENDCRFCTPNRKAAL